jgi:hypothetical protein
MRGKPRRGYFPGPGEILAECLVCDEPDATITSSGMEEALSIGQAASVFPVVKISRQDRPASAGDSSSWVIAASAEDCPSGGVQRGLGVAGCGTCPWLGQAQLLVQPLQDGPSGLCR